MFALPIDRNNRQRGVCCHSVFMGPPWARHPRQTPRRSAGKRGQADAEFALLRPSVSPQFRLHFAGRNAMMPLPEAKPHFTVPNCSRTLREVGLAAVGGTAGYRRNRNAPHLGKRVSVAALLAVLLAGNRPGGPNQTIRLRELWAHGDGRTVSLPAPTPTSARPSQIDRDRREGNRPPCQVADGRLYLLVTLPADAERTFTVSGSAGATPAARSRSPRTAACSPSTAANRRAPAGRIEDHIPSQQIGPVPGHPQGVRGVRRNLRLGSGRPRLDRQELLQSAAQGHRLRDKRQGRGPLRRGNGPPTAVRWRQALPVPTLRDPIGPDSHRDHRRDNGPEPRGQLLEPSLTPNRIPTGRRGKGGASRTRASRRQPDGRQTQPRQTPSSPFLPRPQPNQFAGWRGPPLGLPPSFARCRRGTGQDVAEAAGRTPGSEGLCALTTRATRPFHRHLRAGGSTRSAISPTNFTVSNDANPAAPAVPFSTGRPSRNVNPNVPPAAQPWID